MDRPQDPLNPLSERGVITGDGGILVVCLSSGFGGADVRVLQVARGLHGLCDYAVATLTDSPLAKKLEAAGLNIVGMGTSRADPRLLHRFIALLRCRRFQVVDAHNPQSQLWALLAARVAGTPVRVSSVHHVYGQTEGGAHKRLLYENILRLDRRLGCRFMAVSKEIVTDLKRLGIDGDLITHSDNAVEPAAPRADVGAKLRASLGWDAEHVVVGIFGRLAEQKGHRILLESLAALGTAFPKLRCLVVGGGPLEDDLRQQTSALDLNAVIHFTGFRNDVIDLMHAVDLIAQPSLYEGLPYTVLEASSLGKPMILSAVGGIPDHFVDGQSAILITPGDIGALTEAIRRCCKNDAGRTALGEAARRLVEERFSIEKVLQDSLALYQCDGLLASAPASDPPKVARGMVQDVQGRSLCQSAAR
ncbi:MAG: glycosyltransferase [Geminicoccaceae bacterium]